MMMMMIMAPPRSLSSNNMIVGTLPSHRYGSTNSIVVTPTTLPVGRQRHQSVSSSAPNMVRCCAVMRHHANDDDDEEEKKKKVGHDENDDDDRITTTSSGGCPMSDDTAVSTTMTTSLGERSEMVRTERICLRPATLDDVTMLQKWDEMEHVKDCCGENDNDDDDWDWDYEIRRDVLWRHQLVAEIFIRDGTNGQNGQFLQRKPIGVVQVIDPVLEETQYWIQGRRDDTDVWDPDHEIDVRSDQPEDHRRAETFPDQNFDFTSMAPTEHRAIDIWIGEEDYLGKGYGTEMMQLTLDHYCFGGYDSEGRSDGSSNVTTVWVDPLADNVAAHRFYQRIGFRPLGMWWFGPDRTLVHKLDRTTWEENRRGTKNLDDG